MFRASLLQKLVSPLTSRLSQIESRLLKEIEQNRILAAQPLIQKIGNMGTLDRLADAEFKVFSQWGEDGIIQYLISKVAMENKIFIEFGVQNYGESNSRFLLVNDNWTGLVIDSSQEHIQHIQSQEFYWKYDLTAVREFVTVDNINDLIENAGISGPIGILSIDIDGNDYWIWSAISVVSPQIVIVEYNSSFGNQRAVTIPYKFDFSREKAHYSNLYWGASLPAFCRLASQKGYVYAGSNSAWSNAFFVRNDSAGNIKECDFHRDFDQSKFRDSRDEHGNLSFVSGLNKLEIIKDKYLFDIESNQIVQIKDIIPNNSHE
jgi:hypothetical protein